MMHPEAPAYVVCWVALHLRHPEKATAGDNCFLLKEVIGITKSGETRTLAEFVGSGWSLLNSQWSLHPCKNSGGNCRVFELVGNKMVGNYPVHLSSDCSLLQAH